VFHCLCLFLNLVLGAGRSPFDILRGGNERMTSSLFNKLAHSLGDQGRRSPPSRLTNSRIRGLCYRTAGIITTYLTHVTCINSCILVNNIKGYTIKARWVTHSIYQHTLSESGSNWKKCRQTGRLCFCYSRHLVPNSRGNDMI